MSIPKKQGYLDKSISTNTLRNMFWMKINNTLLIHLVKWLCLNILAQYVEVAKITT
jgi:hypothetical protein